MRTPVTLPSQFTLAVAMSLMPLQAAHVLWSNDFENGVGPAVVPASGANQISVTQGMDPLNPNNNVGVITDKGAVPTGTEWGEVRHHANSYFALAPLNVQAGHDTSNFSVRVYIPSSSVVSATDQINLILRYSSLPMPSTSQFSTNNRGGVKMSDLTRDTWHTLSWTGVVVLKYNSENPLYLTPIITFTDYALGGVYNDSGVFAYFDDILLVTTPEPSKILFCAAGLMSILMRRRRA